MKFCAFHGVEDSGLLRCDTVESGSQHFKDCGTVIITFENVGTMIRISLPNDILCHPRKLQSVATLLRSHFLWIVVQGMFIGCTIFLRDVPFWREGQDRTGQKETCGCSMCRSFMLVICVHECNLFTVFIGMFSCVLLWQLSFFQCFIPSCCQAHLKDCALIHCIVCYRQLITSVWTAMWCSVSSICLMMLSLGMIRWGMHSVCTFNTCHTCSFIVIQHFHLEGYGQYNDSLLKLNEVRHTLDTRDSQEVQRGHLEMNVPEMKSDSFTSNWNMYRFWQ